MRISALNAIRSKALVSVRRNVEGADDKDGLVLSASKSWLLLQSYDNLRPDGFWLFRQNTIRALNQTAFTDYKKHLMSESGLLRSASAIAKMDLSDVFTILNWLTRIRRLVILRAECKDEWWSMHCEIVEAGPDCLRIRPFDGAGRQSRCGIWKRWTPEALTAIRFGSHYLRMYERRLLTKSLPPDKCV